MPAWSDFRQPQRDRPAELMARSIISSLEIPWTKYVRFQRPRWRCLGCRKQYETAMEAYACHAAPEHMFYEVDILAFRRDVLEFDGKIHLKGKGPKHDADRDAFLSAAGFVIHRFPNGCLVDKKGKPTHPEVFENYMRNLKELRLLQSSTNIPL